MINNLGMVHEVIDIIKAHGLSDKDMILLASKISVYFQFVPFMSYLYLHYLITS